MILTGFMTEWHGTHGVERRCGEGARVRLDVEALRVLRTVADAGGFTSAAQQLGSTQSAVSWKIKRLEERLGFELLIRDGNSVRPTVDGQQLLAHADRIIDAHDAAVDHLQRSDLRGTVRLGCNEEVAADQLARVASRFARQHPEADLHIRVHDSAVVSTWLDGGEVDLALLQVVGDVPRSGDRILWRDELVIATARDAADPRKPDDTVPYIGFGERCLYQPWFAAAIHEAGMAFQTVLECPSIQGVQSAVEAGIGVAVLNRRNLSPAMTEWAHADRLGTPPQVTYVIRRGTDATAGTSDLIDALEATITDELDDTEQAA